MTANAKVKDILRNIFYLIFPQHLGKRRKDQQQKSFVLFVGCHVPCWRVLVCKCIRGLTCSRAIGTYWVCSEQQVDINRNGCPLCFFLFVFFFAVHVLFYFWPQCQWKCLSMAHTSSLMCARTLPRVRKPPKLLATEMEVLTSCNTEGSALSQ